MSLHDIPIEIPIKPKYFWRTEDTPCPQHGLNCGNRPTADWNHAVEFLGIESRPYRLGAFFCTCLVCSLGKNICHYFPASLVDERHIIMCPDCHEGNCPEVNT